MNYNRNKTKGRKPYTKGKGSKGNTKDVYPKKDYEEKDNEGYTSHNDVNWYFRDPEIAKQVLTFSCANFLGEQHPIEAPYNNVEIPSFMQMYLNPSPGVVDPSNPRVAGINILALKIYTALSSSNAKNTQYSPQDIMTLILFMGEIISNIEYAKRAFKIAKLYNYRNRSFPRLAVEACGFKYDELIENYADLRMHLNLAINNLNKIPFPSKIPYFDKCAQIYSQVYTDSESPMGQYYIFKPYSTWRLVEDESVEGTILQTTQQWNNVQVFANRAVSMAAYIHFLEGQISDLLTSATFNYVYADILRVAEKESMALYQMPTLGMDEIITPVSDPLVRYQIHNMNFVSAPQEEKIGDFTPSNDVYPDMTNLCLRYNPRFDTAKSNIPTTLLIDFPHSLGNPDEVQKAELTRFMSCAKTVSTVSGKISRASMMSLPDHYAVGWNVLISEGHYLQENGIYEGSAIPSDTNVNHLIQIVNAFDKFDYHPLFRMVDGTTLEVLGLIGDTDFFTTLPYEWFKDANNFITLTLFNIE